MNNLILKKVMAAIALVAVIVIGINAFAEWGGRYGHMKDQAPGWMHRGYGYGHQGYMSGLSEEDAQKMSMEHQAFLENTDDLRQALYAKNLELQRELITKNPNAKRATELQKEISAIKAELDQKWLDHMIKVRRIVPNAGRNWGMGYGHGDMGYAHRGVGYSPEYCW